MTTSKAYPHITGIFGDDENEGVLAVHAQLDPGPNYPDCARISARIIVGSPSATPTIPGYIPDLGGFSCGPDAAGRLIATLQDAVRDVRAAIGGAQPDAPGAPTPTPALWFLAGAGDVLASLPPRPRVVCLCGSTRFYAAFQRANYEETMAGRIVLSIGFVPDRRPTSKDSRFTVSVLDPDFKAEVLHGETFGCTPDQKLALDELHKRKIDMADEVLVLNVGASTRGEIEHGGYVGASTRGEIEHAERTGKPIRWLEPPAARGPVAA